MTTKQNPNDIFWLARYTFNAINPMLEPLDAKIHLAVEYGGRFEGITVYVHANSDSEVLASTYGASTTRQVDAMVGTLHRLTVKAAA